VSRIDSFDPPEANPDVRRRGPRPVTPLGLLRASAKQVWRTLRTMRTALWLLGGLALESILATIVPQEPNVPDTVAAWRAGTEGPGTVVSAGIEVVGGYDVYGSPLFLALLLLLFTSLTACMIPRVRGWWRITRRSQPPRTRHLGAQEHVAHVHTDLSGDEALAAARGVLSDRRYRLRDTAADGPDAEPQVAGEKGQVAREGGSLLFHVSFYVLLVGIVFGQLLGFTGQVGIVEGQAFTDAQVSYWSYQPGRWFGSDDHRGFRLQLDQFNVDWYRDVELAGQPRLFQSDVTVTTPDGETYSDTVGGNDPLVVDGMKIHQLDWGYAPRVVVRQGDEVVHDGFVDANSDEFGWFPTAVKAPAADPDVGLEVVLVPWAPEGPEGEPIPTGAPWADEPLLFYRGWAGDLQLDVPQDVRELDTSRMALGPEGALRLGETVELPNDVTIEFAELRRWVGFQFSDRPTVPLLLVGALLALGGLIPALYAYRRRVWIGTTDLPDGRTLLVVAGRAFQRAEAFAEEFEELADDVRSAVDGTTPDLPDPAAPSPSDGSSTESLPDQPVPDQPVPDQPVPDQESVS